MAAPALLGSDNKAGNGVIMEAAAYLLAIRKSSMSRCEFASCDEKIGHGVDRVDPAARQRRLPLPSAMRATRSQRQTFSMIWPPSKFAVSTSPSIGLKGRMVNTLRRGERLRTRCHRYAFAPETASEREILASVHRVGRRGRNNASDHLRDFDAATGRASQTPAVAAAESRQKFAPPSRLVTLISQHGRRLAREPHASREFTKQALQRLGRTPKLTIISRGMKQFSLPNWVFVFRGSTISISNT